jgi:hypothetical protein
MKKIIKKEQKLAEILLFLKNVRKLKFDSSVLHPFSISSKLEGNPNLNLSLLTTRCQLNSLSFHNDPYKSIYNKQYYLKNNPQYQLHHCKHLLSLKIFEISALNLSTVLTNNPLLNKFCSTVLFPTGLPLLIPAIKNNKSLIKFIAVSLFNFRLFPMFTELVPAFQNHPRIRKIIYPKNAFGFYDAFLILKTCPNLKCPLSVENDQLNFEQYAKFVAKKCISLGLRDTFSDQKVWDSLKTLAQSGNSLESLDNYFYVRRPKELQHLQLFISKSLHLKRIALISLEKRFVKRIVQTINHCSIKEISIVVNNAETEDQDEGERKEEQKEFENAQWREGIVDVFAHNLSLKMFSLKLLISDEWNNDLKQQLIDAYTKNTTIEKFVFNLLEKNEDILNIFCRGLKLNQGLRVLSINLTNQHPQWLDNLFISLKSNKVLYKLWLNFNLTLIPEEIITSIKEGLTECKNLSSLNITNNNWIINNPGLGGVLGRFQTKTKLQVCNIRNTSLQAFTEALSENKKARVIVIKQRIKFERESIITHFTSYFNKVRKLEKLALGAMTITSKELDEFLKRIIKQHSLRKVEVICPIISTRLRMIQKNKYPIFADFSFLTY